MKHILKTFALLTAICVAQLAAAEAPNGYYRSLDGKAGSELKTAVYELIHNFSTPSSNYDKIYSDLRYTFQKTDLYPNSNRWWDMYSDQTFYAPSFSGLNREHSFPKSWWGGLTTVQAYIDLNHLYPSEMKANSAKSNYPLGYVDPNNESFNNGVSRVGSPKTGYGGGANKVYEPDDQYKGDFARTYFYMVTCYQNLSWNTSYMFMVNQNTYPTLQGWASKMLLQWAKEDPVSDKERDRNDAVYAIQNNRNPFIDLPELADYLWGDKAGQPFKAGGSSTTPVGDPVLITPTQGMSLDFGEVALGNSTTAQLFFRGENLTGALDLVISGANKKLFSLPSSSLSTSKVNSPDGAWLTITYKPTEQGQHVAKLIISEGGMMGGSRGVALSGSCLAVPTLTACTATDPTDITADSYRANWTYPANEDIDYWVVSRTKYVGSKIETEEILAEEPGIIIEGFDQSDSEAYSVQSVRLGYRSPQSNVVFVSHSGITGIEADQGLVVEGFDGYLRFICNAPQADARIYDVAGRLILALDQVEGNTDIALPAGIYFVTTANTHATIKATVR